MPQIRVISRKAGDKKGYHRNFSQSEHRFARAREYTRALRAAKLEALHAKPFVASFDGHVETISQIKKVRNKLPTIVSGDWDGELRSWDVASNLLNWKVQGHQGRLMGLTTSNSAFGSDDFNIKNGCNLVISSGQDKSIKIWRLAIPHTARKIWERDDARSSLSGLDGLVDGGYAHGGSGDQKPLSTALYNEPIHCLDASWENKSTLYASGSSQVCLWDVNRSHPLHKFGKGTDHVTCLAFNPANYSLIAAGMQDRKITFYDVRTKSPMPYSTLLNWANEIKWNPIDPRIYVVANNDWCLYTFDVRMNKRALRSHRGHIDAVTSVDWSPTGTEFVSGSVDGHVRIWKSNHQSKDAPKMGYSRELYKAKRMYHVSQVRWTSDGRYVISGSGDGGIRLWKSQRAQPLYKINARQRASLKYAERLKEKYGHMGEIGTIWKFRHAKIPHRIPRNGIFFKKRAG